MRDPFSLTGGEKVMNGMVIGIGNRYRGDDAIGPLIIERLLSKMFPNISISESDGEPTGLISLFQGCDWCIIIDAIIPNIERNISSGMVVLLDLLMEENNQCTELCSTHAGGVFEAIGIARVLGYLPKRVFLVGVVGSSFRSGDQLSQSVQSAIEQALEEVGKLVRSLDN